MEACFNEITADQLAQATHEELPITPMVRRLSKPNYLVAVPLHVVVRILVSIYQLEFEVVEFNGGTDKQILCTVVGRQPGAEHLLVGFLYTPTLQEFASNDTCQMLRIH